MKTRFFRIAAAAVAVVFSACFIIPVLAHTFNDVVWVGAIDPPEGPAGFSAWSDLLSAYGTTVLLDLKSGTVDIPVTLTASEDVTGTFTLSTPPLQTVPSGKTFAASASSSSVTLTAGSPSTVTVTLETDVEATDYSDPDPVSLTFSAEFAIAEKNVSLTADCLMTVIEAERPDPLDGVFDPADTADSFAYGLPIVIDVDGPAIVSFAADFDTIGAFPAKTEYVLGGDRFVMYDGGTIPLYSAAKVSIYLPPLCAMSTVTVSSGSTYEELYLEDPIPELSGDAFYVTVEDDPSAESALALGIPFAWGGVGPAVSFERLEKDGAGDLGFTAADGLSCSADTGGGAQITVPGSAPAGTYRATLKWTVSGVDIFTRDLVFFVIRK